jgi:quinol monooxygenase YgiN
MLRRFQMPEREPIMICVLATIETIPGGRDEMLAVFRKLVPQVRAECGCVEYTPMIDVASGLQGQAPLRDNVVTVVEKWESMAALQSHLATPHMAEFRSRTEHLRRGLTLRILGPASSP